jgi:hypothetical protein
MSRPTSQEASPTRSSPKLLDQMRNAPCLKHYSIRTEESDVNWIRRYIPFHNRRHPAEMGTPRSGSVPHPFGRQGKCRRLYPESGPERSPLPLPRGAPPRPGNPPMATNLSKFPFCVNLVWDFAIGIWLLFGN